VTPTPPPSGPTTFRECGSTGPVDASDADGFDRLWYLERNGAGWTGGDGAISVRLDEGRIAWIFGDSFIGGVLGDGRRSPDYHLVRNTVVVQEGACLTTAVGGTAEAPSALVHPADPGAWYWPQSATADGEVLHVVMQRVVRTGVTNWDFAIVGVDVIDLDVRSFAVTAVRRLPVDGSILWGASVLEADGETYVYGVENTPFDARVFLARAASRALDGEWRFFRGGPEPWSPDPGDAEPLPAAPIEEGAAPSPLTGLSATITVLADAEGVVLVSQAPVFATAVTARRAPAPEGPFTGPEVIATATAPPVPEAFTYGTRVHPQLAADGLQLLAWNVSSFGDLLTNASLYRPRFTAIEWPPPAGQPPGIRARP
jgi:hypothetical protein